MFDGSRYMYLQAVEDVGPVDKRRFVLDVTFLSRPTGKFDCMSLQKESHFPD